MNISILSLVRIYTAAEVRLSLYKGRSIKMGQTYSNYSISGSIAPGYESVKKLFEENFRSGQEESAQVCVYVDGECVVDLWGAMDRDDRMLEKYNGDTLTTVYSSTKSLTSLVVAMMVDRGLLRYDEKIAHYWPEFGSNGKEDITVADLMKHQAGLSYFDCTIDLEDALVENIKKNNIGEVIEKQILRFPKNDEMAVKAGVPGKRQYHAFSRGWIANEIVRRVHPENFTIGEILKKDVSTPLKAEVYIGVDEEQLDNYAPGEEIKFSYLLRQGFIPKRLGRSTDNNIFELLNVLNDLKKMFTTEPGIPAIFEGLEPGLSSKTFNKETVRKGETPSVNGNCSARGLAKIAATIANGGSLGDVQLLTNKGVEELHANPSEDFLGGQVLITMTQGGVCPFPNSETETQNGRGGYIGWLGYGGSVFLWHQELKIGFAYTPTLLNWTDPFNAKGARLQEEVA